MPLQPPPALIELLSRLGLATPAEVQRAASRVKRLGRGLASFDRVWVDALAQMGKLTPFQAGEINAGRADALVVGPFILEQPLENLGYAITYRARRRAIAEPGLATTPTIELKRGTQRNTVRLAVAAIDVAKQPSLAAQLDELIERGRAIPSPQVEPIEAYGFAGDRLWVCSRYHSGLSAAEWLVRQGRVLPAAVLEIARQTVTGLQACHRAGIVHGDLSVRQLLWQKRGRAWFTFPGLRGLLRPDERVESDGLTLEAFDDLAPERAAGAPPTVGSDMTSLGLVWWHLLAGRAPWTGSDRLARLQKAARRELAEITHLVAEVPAPLLAAIYAATEREPTLQLANADELATKLGAGCELQQKIASRIQSLAARRPAWGNPAPPRRTFRGLAQSVAVLAGLVLIVVAGTWPQWQPKVSQRISHEIAAALPAAPPGAPSKPSTVNASTKVNPAANEARPPHEPGPWLGTVWEGKELVLTGNEPVKAATLTLQRPTTIRGKLGQRGVIAVGADGWHIAADEIRFENIDFVADELAAGNPMIRLAARRAEFIGCSWQQTIAEPSTALAWNPPKNAAAETILRGEIHLIDCLLQRVGGGIRTAGGAAVLIELANVLHLGPGPLVTLDEAPETGEAIELMATHVTLRDAQGLLACNCDAIPDEPGRFLIVTDDCVLVPATAAGLILFSGAHQPAPLLRSIEWKGQGSVVATQASLCVWRDNEGTLRGAADDQLYAAGLVRNDVTFSGANNHGPAGSRVLRWQAPRQSADPPGIRETKPLPSGMLR